MSYYFLPQINQLLVSIYVGVESKLTTVALFDIIKEHVAQCNGVAR